MNDYQTREREREELEDELRRGVREINKTIKNTEGWSDRIMAALLAPLDHNLDIYPIGHKTPNKGNLTKIDWNI